MTDPIAAQTEAARELLASLGFDPGRANERSALVLLALLRLGPGETFAEATNPTLRVVEIMEWIRTEYGKDYKPNTRETIRRQTLHQFVEAGLVLLNPDKPRPTNSPRNCYQVTDRGLELIRSAADAEFSTLLSDYLSDLPGLREIYARERQLEMVPVTLPGGEPVHLSPAGQNVLLKAMIEEFCPRWTAGGEVLYIGDTGKDDPVFESTRLSDLGIDLDKHGKLPDLIVYMPDRNWLVLLEAASTHGPVDGKRHGELVALFGTSSAGLVFVSCFPSRADMRKYLADISWETEVWCADAPTHLIHFNGERFLGPYETGGPAA